ncbi:HAD family hydrolase [Mycetocola sp.]|jgi:putative hydrolase of the HAD superfamily|uniref:HAD family hydrolase n=1 Tax=Mycetocola sp. TaxID=1871042 RepID=UPI00263213A5|nr:HAD family hydrolase [Mycetocola sp.]MCU1419151.1 family hydrolase [Mycetocola sp.]MCU1561049.1 family hydrolase [Mycetocola sp.]
MTKLALFDLDDTLMDHRGAVSRGILRHVDETAPFPLPDREHSVALWHELEDRHYHRYLSKELTFAGQRRARALDFAAAHGVTLSEVEADAWFDTYFESYRGAWELFDDAIPCLDRLADAGVRVGVITNGELDFQRVKLERTGLGDRFEHVIASGAVGVAKPDPKIFERACALFGIAPEEAMYVGDRLLTDAVGAASAGLAGVWLNRFGGDVVVGGIGHGKTSEDPVELAQAAGVRTITTLDEL